MNNLHKLNSKKLIKTTFLTALVLISTVLNIMVIESETENEVQKTTFENNIYSASAVENNWNGTGNNQSVRVYLQNVSQSIDQTDSFNISAPFSPSKIFLTSELPNKSMTIGIYRSLCFSLILLTT